jgi:hypothetical protein
MTTDGRSLGENVAEVVAEIILYVVCLSFAWWLGGVLRGRFWGTIAIIISVLLFMRAEQCRRETRAAGDPNTGFYIMIPFMSGVVLLLSRWLRHV